MKWQCLLLALMVALSGCTERKDSGSDPAADVPGVDGDWLLASAAARLAETEMPGSAFTVSGEVAAHANDTRVAGADASSPPGPGYALKWTIQLDVEGSVHICRVDVRGAECGEAGYATPVGQVPFLEMETDSDTAFLRFEADDGFASASKDPTDRLALGYSDARWTMTVTDQTNGSGGEWTWDIGSDKVAGETW